MSTRQVSSESYVRFWDASRKTYVNMPHMVLADGPQLHFRDKLRLAYYILRRAKQDVSAVLAG